jgi:hypothetical protein
VSERVKLSFLCLLLLLMLGILALTAVNTLQAVRSFQQQYSAINAGDVSTIHPWMTIHAVSRIYHVPEDYLYSSLHIGSPAVLRHVTLYEIASRKRQPVDQVIRAIQHAILAYRKGHPRFLTPSPAPKPLSPTPGRT